MKKISFMPTLAGAVAVALIAVPSSVKADSVSAQSFDSSPAAINLDTFAAWAYYADYLHPNLTFGTIPTPTTDAANLASFTDFTTTGGAEFQPDTYDGGSPAISYTNGSGGPNGPTQSGATKYDFVGDENGPGGGGFTLTTKLIAPTETLHFFLLGYHTNLDLSVNVGGQDFSLFTDEPLSGNGTGELSVTVNGGIGEILTFIDNTNTNGVPDASSANNGIIAVAIDVPEPSTYAMLLAGMAFLGFLVRRKAARFSV